MAKHALIVVVAMILLVADVCLADVPQLISFQGKLYDNTGNPVTGQKNITFRLYTVELGGTHVWSELKNVTCDNGLYSVILGQTTPLNLSFATQHWLGVQVAGDSELAPRYRLASVPTAFRAQDANGVNGIAASTTPTANSLFPLGADGKYPASVLPLTLPPDPHAAAHNEGGSDPVTVTSSLIHDGTISSADLADNAVTTAQIQPDVLSSIDGVANDGGNVDLVAGSNITITPNNAANTITISATATGSDAWKLTGNAGTDPTTNFLGTTDNQSLELRVNGDRALRLEPNVSSPNLIGGFSGNSVTGGKYGATIAGGGASGATNTVTENYGTIGGGEQNIAGGETATVGGGGNNRAEGNSAVVSGGSGNTASNNYATVGGGYSNEAQGPCGTISGGQDNDISYGASCASIGGGRYNSASYEYATVGGGFSNSASASYATISGGGRSSPGDPSTGNRVTDDYGTIGGGGNNQAGDDLGTVNSATYTTIGGGYKNFASGQYATVGGGYNNVAFAIGSTIAGGGYYNLVTDSYGTIGGGTQNQAGDGATDPESAAHATVGGGYNNVARGEFSFIGGGFTNNAFEKGASIGGGGHNWAAAKYATIAGGGPVDESFVSGNEVIDNYGTVGGGGWNQAGSEDIDPTNSQYATVPGGRENKAIGAYSFAAGRRAIADGEGSFVWGDSNDNDIHAWGANQFVVRATGGCWFITKVDETGYPVEGMQLPANSSSWVPLGSTTVQFSQDQTDHIQKLEAENSSLRLRLEELEKRLEALEQQGR